MDEARTEVVGSIVEQAGIATSIDNDGLVFGGVAGVAGVIGLAVLLWAGQKQCAQAEHQG
jgi:hypothetical protein